MAKHPQIRELIKEAQRILGVEEDGLPGPNTERALTELMTDQINPAVRPKTLVTLLLEYMQQIDNPLIHNPLVWVDHKRSRNGKASADT